MKSISRVLWKGDDKRKLTSDLLREFKEQGWTHFHIEDHPRSKYVRLVGTKLVGTK